MKDKLILYPDIKEPQPGEIFRAKDGNWYFCVLGTDCYDCDIDCEDTSKCEYRSLCSCFKRKEFSSVVFRYVRNLPEIIEQLIGEEKIEMNTSNDKEQFSTGAVRDKADDKPRPELISPFAIERLAAWLRDGAHKYGDRNWEAGMPAERTTASLLRHIIKYMQGDRSEDNLAGIMCNAMFLLDVDEKVKRGILPETLLNLPVYPSNKDASKHISPFAKERLEKWLQSDSENWDGIITAQKCLDNMIEHLNEYQEDTNDPVDHIAAALANLMRIVHIDEGVKRGLLPASLLDFPFDQNVTDTDK